MRTDGHDAVRGAGADRPGIESGGIVAGQFAGSGGVLPVATSGGTGAAVGASSVPDSRAGFSMLTRAPAELRGGPVRELRQAEPIVVVGPMFTRRHVAPRAAPRAGGVLTSPTHGR
ncbi:hypothetical protein [Phytoactinopolyspora mesophila]|uniref:Uncharacterized protein n=1 Tax=Phytoactinopolyspora mesophila TaxID=2650750 RepID=A0A7K3MBI8_9ACTN|nr:hypothetical protein [Phytoactinopolyspora mesophila]NDL60679.1 hypothetical protein [Phytoactinopolyspora mesophila]